MEQPSKMPKSRFQHHFVYDQDELLIFLTTIAKKRWHIEKVDKVDDAEYKYHVVYWY